MPFYPGPGLGGHCIPIDPFYLSWKAKQTGFEPRFIELAGQVNGAMPHAVVDKIADALNAQRKALNGSRVLVVGVAYKRDIDDIRESPSLDVMGAAAPEGRARARTPIRSCRRCAARAWHGGYDLDIGRRSTPATLAGVDCVAILTDHSAIDYDTLVAAAPLVVDTRNAIKQAHPHVFRLGAPQPAHAARWRPAAPPRQAAGVDVREPGRCDCVFWVSAAGHRVRRMWAIRPLPAFCGRDWRAEPSAMLAIAAPARRLPRVSIVDRRAERGGGGCRPASRICSRSTIRPTAAQIIVVSDGSTDDTVDGARRVRVDVRAAARRAGVRQGGGVERSASLARAGDILVFADARQTFAPDALRALVAPFADPRVGGVTGELILDVRSPAAGRRAGATPSGAANAAHRHDRRAATPAPIARPCASTVARRRRPLLAIREAAAAPRERGRLDARRDRRDLRAAAIACGSRCRPARFSTTCWRRCARCWPAYRVVFERAARGVRSTRRRCRRRSAGGRSARSPGNVQILWLEPRLLVPVVNPVWLQYASHKVGRLLVPYALLALLRVEHRLAGDRSFYAVALAAQMRLYLLGATARGWSSAPGRARLGRSARSCRNAQRDSERHGASLLEPARHAWRSRSS